MLINCQSKYTKIMINDKREAVEEKKRKKKEKEGERLDSE